MCGRYQFNLNQSAFGKKIKEQATKLNLVYQEGEIFPTNQVLCIIPYEVGVSLASKKWGIKRDKLQINARIESLNDHTTYRLNEFWRCAILCNGFYEWDKQKQKYFISFKKEYQYLAAIFNENDELLIITEPSYKTFTNIHDRIPLILDKEEMLAYIHNEPCQNKQKSLIIRQVVNEQALF